MPTAGRSNGNSAVRRCHILIGYNLPFLLWTGYAAVGVVAPGTRLWSCPIRPVTGWCPGCGLTSQYTCFLQGNGVPEMWFMLVLAFFVFNAGCSVVRAWKVVNEPLPENSA